VYGYDTKLAEKNVLVCYQNNKNQTVRRSYPMGSHEVMFVVVYRFIASHRG